MPLQPAPQPGRENRKSSASALPGSLIRPPSRSRSTNAATAAMLYRGEIAPTHTGPVSDNEVTDLRPHHAVIPTLVGRTAVMRALIAIAGLRSYALIIEVLTLESGRCQPADPPATRTSARAAVDTPADYVMGTAQRTIGSASISAADWASLSHRWTTAWRRKINVLPPWATATRR